MRRYLLLLAVAGTLLFMPARCASAPRPSWSVDLQTRGVTENSEAVVLFCGPFLIVYPEKDPSPLVVDIATHRQVREERKAQLPCNVRHALLQSTSHLPDLSSRVVARRKEMSVVQICDQPICAQPPGKPSVRDSKFYLRVPGREDTLIWQAHCLPSLPVFLSDDRILVFNCDMKTLVVDRSGRQAYGLPTFSMPWFALDREGSRFAVYERDSSFFHQFEGTDRLRLRVYRSSDGKELFKLRWRPGNEAFNDGRVALSDDGALLALLRGGQLLVFALPQ
jgi:hypothetical protein